MTRFILFAVPRLSVIVLCTISLASLKAQADPRSGPPNIVLIFMDDMGYADIGPFGARGYATPNLDRMAAEGMRFTDFQVSSAVCSASRAALLTGCYHRRIGITGALGPGARHGIHADEVTLAELCQQQGYATACFGKWHLGHHPKFLPLQHGFDEYFGLPYSNDMWPFHPMYLNFPPDDARRNNGFPRLPLIEGNRVIDADVTPKEQEDLTKLYTERAVDFIRRSKDRPFFLYLPHSMVHVPLFVSKAFRGKSKSGLFGDVVMEIDWSVGEIQKAVEDADLDRRTLFIFTSDNGPWLSYGDHGGSSGPFREGKGTMFEGGSRVPTVMRWTGRIPPGRTCDELAATIDILPTVAKLIGASLPDHRIDGADISDLMFGREGARSPHDVFYSYYAGGQLQAVRDRRWKLFFPHSYRTMAGHPGGSNGTPAPYTQRRLPQSLFDLKNDPGEHHDVASEHSEIVQRLIKRASEARTDLGDTLTGVTGQGIRPAGRLEPADERLIW